MVTPSDSTKTPPTRTPLTRGYAFHASATTTDPTARTLIAGAAAPVPAGVGATPSTLASSDKTSR